MVQKSCHAVIHNPGDERRAHRQARYRRELLVEVYIGSIFLFAGNFAPQNFQYCWGQTLAISQYQALFAILGTTYGGNGTTNFQLPDLRGRVPVGAGTGSSLPPVVPGQTGGSQSVA